MIRLRLDQLIREKQAEWNRDVTYREISEKTGIALSTLVRLRKNQGKRIDLDVLDTLYKFFECQSITDLLVFVPDESADVQAGEADEAS